MKGYIYKITSPSGKVYIGQTKNIKQRLYFYSTYNCKTQTKLYNSIKKYGWCEHTFEILEEIDYDVDKLNELEVFYINEYGCLENGLNIRPGGKNSTISDDGRRRLSERMLGENNPMFGKKPWNYGNGQSKEELDSKKRDYYYKNKDKIKEYYSQYCVENKDRLEEYRRSYINPNINTDEYKEKRRISVKKWKDKNKERIREYNKTYWEEHKNKDN